MQTFLRICFWTLFVLGAVVYVQQFIAYGWRPQSINPLDAITALIVGSIGLIGLAITYPPREKRQD